MKSTSRVSNKRSITWVTVFTLASGASVVIPEGRELVCINCDHADFADVDVMMDNGVAIVQATGEGGGNLSPKAQNLVTYYATPIPATGGILSLKNNGAGGVTNISYGYVEPI